MVRTDTRVSRTQRSTKEVAVTSGLSYPTLVDRLLELAMERHKERSSLETTYRPG